MSRKLLGEFFQIVVDRFASITWGLRRSLFAVREVGTGVSSPWKTRRAKVQST